MITRDDKGEGCGSKGSGVQTLGKQPLSMTASPFPLSSRVLDGPGGPPKKMNMRPGPHVRRSAAEGSPVSRTTTGNAGYDAQREFSSPATNMGGRVEPFGWVGERVRGQNPLIVRTGVGERVILFEHRIRGFQEWSAELQIPRLPRISCRELRLRSTACGSLYGEPHAWLPVRAVR